MYMQEMLLRHKSIRKQTAPLYSSSTLRQSTQPFGLQHTPRSQEGLVSAPLVGTGAKTPPLWNRAFIPDVLLFLHLHLLQKQGSTHLLWKKGDEPSSKGVLPEVGGKYLPSCCWSEGEISAGHWLSNPLYPCTGNSQGPVLGTDTWHLGIPSWGAVPPLSPMEETGNSLC